MPQHTPGPWINCHTHVDDSCGLPLIVAATREFNAINCSDFALIAAAPELLAALESMIYYHDAFRDKSPVGPTEADDIAAARSAIAKARGEVTT